MRRNTLAAAVAGLCLAALPAAALGAEGPEASATPEGIELSVEPLAVALTVEDRPEAPPAPPGEQSPDQPPPIDVSRPDGPVRWAGRSRSARGLGAGVVRARRGDLDVFRLQQRQ